MASKNVEKILDQILELSILETAELSKGLQEKTGISAAMPAAAAPVVGAEAPAQAEEKSEYKVTLQEPGDKKIDVIKALRKVVVNLSLTDAKKLVESTPSVVAEAAPKDDAKKMKETLEAAGAKVQLG